MKIAVIGSNGMLGEDLVKKLQQTEHKVFSFDIPEIDITNQESLEKIRPITPDVIINCAAYTNVDLAEKEKEKCKKINVLGINNLANLCLKLGCALIQISSDYVFGGTKQGYDENDSKKPLNYYGLTKSQGEDIIIKKLNRYQIVRTSWLFGENGKNFIDVMLELCSKQNMVKVVKDQTGSPTYTLDLSEAIIGLLGYSPGIYHITNSGTCSWFDFAKEIVKLSNLKCTVKPCTSEEFPREAKRPTYSILNNHKLLPLRPWQEALKHYLEVKK